MSDILRKFRRGATLLGELIKYEAAALCAGVLAAAAYLIYGFAFL